MPRSRERRNCHRKIGNMRTSYLRRVSVHRNPRWQNSAVRDVTAADQIINYSFFFVLSKYDF
jgi:hypothetical protein